MDAGIESTGENGARLREKESSGSVQRLRNNATMADYEGNTISLVMGASNKHFRAPFALDCLVQHRDMFITT